MADIWIFDPEKNDGFPYVVYGEDMPEKAQEKPYPLYLWRIKSGVNSGYPYFLLQPAPAPAPVPPVSQGNYICIYDMRTPYADFVKNGLAVLEPTSCEITEILNGEYSLRMVHPIDPDGKWQYIREENIIKALGQLFTIKTVTWEHSSANGGTVTVYAEHLFYQVGDPWIMPFSEPFSNTSCKLTMEEAMFRAYHHREEGQHFYQFRCDSDWEWETPYIMTNDNGRSVIDVLIGSGGIIDVKGGELYRDNNYFSINETMENAQSDAFDIRIGRNLTGVTRTVDLSTFCSYYRGFESYGGGWFAWAWKPDEFINTQFPHHVVRSKNYTYDSNLDYDTIWERFKQEVTADFKKNCRPVISYEVDLADVRRNPDFAENNPNFAYKPGNTGRIVDERLSDTGCLTIKITETVTDAITGDVVRVVFGSRQSFTRSANYPVVLDITPEPQVLEVPVRDADGVFCYDSDGVRIVESLI